MEDYDRVIPNEFGKFASDLEVKLLNRYNIDDIIQPKEDIH